MEKDGKEWNAWEVECWTNVLVQSIHELQTTCTTEGCECLLPSSKNHFFVEVDSSIPSFDSFRKKKEVQAYCEMNFHCTSWQDVIRRM
jgi:hypothetical protein